MKLTVVIAVWQEPSSLADCLQALAEQMSSRTQVIACATIDPPEAARRHSWLQWRRQPADLLIPELWARGISAADGEVVALTTAHFVPRPDWLARIREAHRRLDSVGIGGAFDPPRGGSLADWATYFLRYSAYLEYREERDVVEIAADNASYKRSALDAHRELIDDAFWEPDFHRLALAEGETLTFDPTIRVVQRSSFGVRRFCGQRWCHGRQFGASRMRGRSWPMRWAGALAFPLIPLIVVAKVGGRVLRNRRDLGPFAASLPILGLFACAWAAGEVWGYLFGA
ncbi:MAG: glycosyltransferase [Thermoanaerobaculia bacterium]